MKALTQDSVVGQTAVDVHNHLAEVLADLSKGALTAADVALTPAPAHTGADLSFRCFELARSWKKAPAQIAQEIAQTLNDRTDNMSDPSPAAIWTPAGPYVNITLDHRVLAPRILDAVRNDAESYGHNEQLADEVVMMEYVSPNTNKPLHLGHMRNAILGRAVANLIAAQGAKVIRTDIINDRGIHIAKSMLAFQRWADGATPESSGVKGDHFVGGLYVRYDKELRQEKAAWLTKEGIDLESLNEKEKKQVGERFNEASEISAATRDLLKRWEAGDEEVRALWRKMNGWVYDGFNATYDRLGIHFDQHYYESEIYEGGRDVILGAVEKGIFKRAENGAVIAPLSEHFKKLQDKAVLRADGTSLYITQDINLATIKFEEHGLTRSLYCIGSEQDYYMKQLFATLKLLGFEWADGLHHLSYGMVYLPEGKMKSREGTVVDADNLMDTLRPLATEKILEYDPELSGDPLTQRAEAIGLAALVFMLLSVGRESDVQFDPRKSVEFEGKTGPYLQYAHARIASILRKAEGWEAPEQLTLSEDIEWRILFQMLLFPNVVADAAESHDPSILTSFLYELTRDYSRYNHDHHVLNAEEPIRSSRLALLVGLKTVLANGLRLLAIEPLEEM